MSEIRTIDGRNLQPPEPLERTLDALGSLGREERLQLLVPHEPHPLYAILRGNGYSWRSERQDDGTYSVLIWHGP